MHSIPIPQQRPQRSEELGKCPFEEHPRRHGEDPEIRLLRERGQHARDEMRDFELGDCLLPGPHTVDGVRDAEEDYPGRAFGA